MIKQLLLSLLFVSSAASAQIDLSLPDMTFITCDDEIPDGLATFDLTAIQETILSGLPDPQDYSVDFYPNPSLALAGDPETMISFPSAYINTANPQTVGVRVYEIANPENYDIANLVLNVDPLPPIQPNVPDLIVYSTDASGFAGFALDIQIQNIVLSTSHVVTFYENLPDAQNGANAIMGCYTNVIPGQQTIHFRVTDLNSYCVSLGSFNLIVSPDPNPNELLGVPDNQFLYSLFLADETNNIAFDACGNSMIVDTNDDGIIQLDEAARVFALDVSNRGIASLEGINAFTSLRSLTTDNNPLTSLDLSGIPVTELSCIDNNLEWINLTNGMLHQALESGTTPWSGNPNLWKVCGDDAE